MNRTRGSGIRNANATSVPVGVKVRPIWLKLTQSDTNLVNKIHSGDALSDGMLDLKSGVHLQEVEVLLRVEQELDSSGRVVADGLGKPNGLLSHGGSGENWSHQKDRSLLSKFLDVVGSNPLAQRLTAPSITLRLAGQVYKNDRAGWSKKSKHNKIGQCMWLSW